MGKLVRRLVLSHFVASTLSWRTLESTLSSRLCIYWTARNEVCSQWQVLFKKATRLKLQVRFFPLLYNLSPDLACLHDETPPPKEAKHKPTAEPSKPEPTGSASSGGLDPHGLLPEAYEKAAKSAKFAIGCLQYKDKDAAIKYLQEALCHLKTH